MRVVSLTNNRGLGDTMAILASLHSLNVETGKAFTVHGPAYVQTLLDLFDMPGVAYAGLSPDGLKMTTPIARLLPGHIRWTEDRGHCCAFLAGLLFRTDSPPDCRPNKITLPTLKMPLPPKERHVCFQFDSRSTHAQKPPLTADDARNLLARFGGENNVGVGGHETTPYLPEYEFRLGDLRHLTRNMLACQKFVGADSGMSHLAGFCRTRGDVIIMHSNPTCVRELVAFYNMAYPSLTIHTRQKTTPAML